MHFYKTLACQAGTPEARDLADRLAVWHDAMVNHERRLRADDSSTGCTSPCPHDEARELWEEARKMFGSEAGSLAFLRSRAIGHGPTVRES
jgi:hypothetical protein